jgi:hypothetical protein
MVTVDDDIKDLPDSEKYTTTSLAVDLLAG